MEFTAETFFDQLISQRPALPVSRVLNGEMMIEEWRGKLREQVLCGLETMCFDSLLNICELERVPCEGYTRVKLRYTVEPGLMTPAYLLIPDGYQKGSAAVLAVHGHGYGVKDIVGLNPDWERADRGARL